MNRTELQQVLVNLIVNAIHAMPEGGTLTMCTLDPDVDGKPGLAIEIADTGVGIDPEPMEKIFDPFFTTKRQEGTGLGLSISQTLVARQGGRITVESEPAAGSTVQRSGCRKPTDSSAGHFVRAVGHFVRRAVRPLVS